MLDKFAATGEAVITPYWVHAVQSTIAFDILPSFLSRLMIRNAIAPFVESAARTRDVQ